MSNSLKTALLLGLLTGIILRIGQLFGGAQGLIIAFLLAVLLNFGTYWFSDKIMLAPIAAMMIPRAISRSREFLADATGARICGNPLGLAAALRKLGRAGQMIPLESGRPETAYRYIVNPLSSRFVMRFFSTHPPIEERIARLEAMAYSSRLTA